MTNTIVHEALIYGAGINTARVLPHPTTQPIGRPYRHGEPPPCEKGMKMPKDETFCMDQGSYCVGPGIVYAAGEAPCPTDPGCDLPCKRDIQQQFGRLWYNFGPCQHIYPGSGCPPDPARLPSAKRLWERTHGQAPLGAQLPTFPLTPPIPTPGSGHVNCNVNGIVVACPPICQPPACTAWIGP